MAVSSKKSTMKVDLDDGPWSSVLRTIQSSEGRIHDQASPSVDERTSTSIVKTSTEVSEEKTAEPKLSKQSTPSSTNARKGNPPASRAYISTQACRQMTAKTAQEAETPAG